MRRLLLAGTDKCSINSAAVARPGAGARGRARNSAASASWSRSTPSRPAPARWEVFTHGGRRATGIDAIDWCRQVAGAGRRRNPADQHGPRRHRPGLRPRPAARGLRRGAGAGDRLGRRRHAGRISSRARRPAPPACWPPACSISARSPSPQVKAALARRRPAGAPAARRRPDGARMGKSAQAGAGASRKRREAAKPTAKQRPGACRRRCPARGARPPVCRRRSAAAPPTPRSATRPACCRAAPPRSRRNSARKPSSA